MLRLKTAPALAEEWNISRDLLEFDEVVTIILRLTYRYRVRVVASELAVQVVGHTSQKPYAMIHPGKKPADYSKLLLFCQLAARLMEYREGMCDLTAVQACSRNTRGKHMAIDPAIDRSDTGAIIVYMVGWLIGRKLTTQLKSEEDILTLVRTYKSKMVT